MIIFFLNNYELQTQNNRVMTEKTIPYRKFNGSKAYKQLIINRFNRSSLTVLSGIFTH